MRTSIRRIPISRRSSPTGTTPRVAFDKISYIPPNTPYDTEANDIFTRHVNDWWSGKVSTQAMLQGTAAELRSKLKLA